MTAYRYLCTNILTGQVLFDNLPVTVSSCTSQLNGIGSCSGVLQLYNGIPNDVHLDMIAALEPFKSVFWVFQDNVPIWGGPIISWSPTTMQGSTLPFQAATLETIMQYRLITDTFVYNNTDIAAIFRFLGQYALSKTPNGDIAGFNMTGPHVNFNVNVTFDQSNSQSVYDAWTSLVQTYDLEFTIQPAWTSSNSLGFNLLIGKPLMRPVSDTNMQFVYPSHSVLDYQWTRQASSLGNYVHVTGTDGISAAFVYNSTSPHGVNTAELNAGYPLLETTVSMQQPVLNGAADVNSYADTWAKTSSIRTQVTPVIMLAPDGFPRVSDIVLGDECLFAATSPIHPAQSQPAGGPGVIYDGRITGWTVVPPSQGNPESTTINLGALTAISGGV